MTHIDVERFDCIEICLNELGAASRLDLIEPVSLSLSIFLKDHNSTSEPRLSIKIHPFT